MITLTPHRRPARPTHAWLQTWHRARPALLVLAALIAPAAPAAPWTPQDDAEVIERLPGRPDAAQRARRAALARDPGQLPLALATAQEAITRARRDGDPRELGAAQAALAPWWADPLAPAPVRLLRATVRQARHDFDGARADLDTLSADPRTAPPLRAQALLTRAGVHQIQGRWSAAAADCQALLQPDLSAAVPAVRRLAQACQLELQSLTDAPPAARRALDALASAGPQDAWLALLRAEAAERQGDDAAAARLWPQAAVDGGVYARAAWADWLLDRGRHREALAALDAGGAPGLEADALLLRRAIAWQRLGDARATGAAAQLRQRFAAARLRGDSPHWREEARLALDIDRDTTRALDAARRQWALQKEPADAVLLWRAARAAGRPQEARALQGWLPAPARADIRLAGLDEVLRSTP